jgi:hypothetical protein
VRRLPLLSPPQRETLLTLSTAVLGLSIGIALYPVWLRPAPIGQLPGYMTSVHYDARAPMRFFLGVVVLTFLAPLALRPVVRLLSRPDTRAWSRNGAATAGLVALWYVSISRNVLWTAVPASLAIAIFAALRRVDLRFTKRDALLIPTVGAVFLALADLTAAPMEQVAVWAVAIVIGLRVALVFIRPGAGLAASLCFSAAPLAIMLESPFLARDQRHAGWPALAVVILTPLILRLTLDDAPATRRRIRTVVVLAVYPLAAFGYATATSVVSAEGKPRVEFFEDAQHLAPAGEILHGEKPYRDIIPPHGLIQDGLLDAIILGHEPPTIGRVLRTRGTIGALMAIATYVLATAIARSPDIGFIAVFVTHLLGYGSTSVRFLPWMIAVGLIAMAAGRKSTLLFGLSGAATILAGLTSVETGCYAIVALAVAVARVPGDGSRRRHAMTAAAIGVAGAAACASLAMIIRGYFVDFLRVTFREILTLGPVYSLTAFTPPPALDRQFPEVLTAIFDRTAMHYCIWIATLSGLAVFSARGTRARGQRRSRYDALVVLATSIVISGISYAERHHLYFAFLVPSLLVSVAWLLLRSRSSATRITAYALILIIATLSGVSSHFAISAWLRRWRGGPLDPGWTAIDLPRGQGAWFRDDNVATIAAVKGYIDKNFASDDTFFDLTSRPMLYFLLDRDIPVRQLEAAFYEAEDRQREVIARIQLNPHVRAALVPPPNDSRALDGVSARIRAPLVWKFLQENFQPDFQSGDVVIWKRR